MPWRWLFPAVVGPPGPAAECGGWNTAEFFKTAPPGRVRACLAAGAGSPGGVVVLSFDRRQGPQGRIHTSG